MLSTSYWDMLTIINKIVGQSVVIEMYKGPNFLCSLTAPYPASASPSLVSFCNHCTRIIMAPALKAFSR